MHEQEHPVTNTFQTDTDLPLLPSGNNGNNGLAPEGATTASIARLLERVFEPLPEPAFDLLDPRAVREWIECATAHLHSRRDGQRLVREAMRLLDDDWQTAMASERLQAQALRQRERLMAKLEPGYWCDRDHRRQASRPIHVIVDLSAWRRAKTRAVARRSSVGVVIGELVTREVRRPRRRVGGTDPSVDATRLFTRIAVSPESWARFRALAGREVTIERYVGILVEEAFPK